ncbi:MAG: HIT family protein [Euryarchaeota archaeon]|nr:HIT family protein [Euryarchaeota archaeon]MDE2044998.1 HIT family protein [Thermoplasmata archaeon]
MPPEASPAGPCIFCSIARHEAPARIVYEDEGTIAFLDKFPLSRGHTLVVPKGHVDRLTELPREQYTPLLSTLSEVCRRVERLSRHYNVGVNQGALAGQIVFHLHFHVIPRYEDQPTFPRQRRGISDEEGKEVHGLLSRA